MSFKLLIIGAIVLLSAISPVLAADNPPLEKYSESRLLLGSVLHLDVCYAPEQAERVKEAAQKAWERLSEINRRMNIYDEKSDLSVLNRAGGAPAAVHAEVYALMKRSVEFKAKTRGVFDITVRPLSRLWKKAAAENRFPTRAEVLSARRLVDSRRIVFLDGGAVQLPGPEMSVDLNGNAQGYAADEVAGILRQAGFTNFMMDASGEIYAAGLNCSGHKWRIAVRNPFRPDRLIEALELTDAAVSTSGGYERFYEIQGRKLSHIINPLTGYPQREVAGATVVAPSAIEADVLSTALCILGPERGLSVIKELGEGYGAVIYSHDANGHRKRAVAGVYEKLLTGKKRSQ